MRRRQRDRGRVKYNRQLNEKKKNFDAGLQFDYNEPNNEDRLESNYIEGKLPLTWS